MRSTGGAGRGREALGSSITCEGVSSPPRVRAVPLKFVGAGVEGADGSSGRARFLGGKKVSNVGFSSWVKKGKECLNILSSSFEDFLLQGLGVLVGILDRETGFLTAGKEVLLSVFVAIIAVVIMAVASLSATVASAEVPQCGELLLGRSSRA